MHERKYCTESKQKLPFFDPAFPLQMIYVIYGWSLTKGIPIQLGSSAATADFWQARLPQWRPHLRRAAAAAITFYFARQDLGLGGLACRGAAALGSM